MVIMFTSLNAVVELMNNEVFASVYIDECLSPLLASLIRQEGWDAVSSYDVNLNGASDILQLSKAVSLGRVMVTVDKPDFINLACASAHTGIILVPRQIRLSMYRSIAKAICKLLNTYTKDEFCGLLLWAKLK